VAEMRRIEASSVNRNPSCRHGATITLAPRP
jgi:hypothetical protein